MSMGEHEDLPRDFDAADLPAGERVLLRTRPDWWRLALTAFHLRAVAAYFVVFAVWRLGATYNDTGSWAVAAREVVQMIAPFAVGLALLLALAWATARATSFTITDRRLVLRYGVALPAQVNIPLADVDTAGVRLRRDGTADIPLGLPAGARGCPSYFQLWPYARPWKIGRAEPMLRAVPEGEAVARCLSRALHASQGFGEAVAAPVSGSDRTLATKTATTGGRTPTHDAATSAAAV